MKRFLALTAAAFLAAGAWAQAIPVILDTDTGNDADDALALAMLHALESRSHHVQNARGRGLHILSLGSHRTSTALTSPTPSDGKANFTTVGPFVSGGHSNATSPHVVPPGATAFACTSAFSTLPGACPSLVTRIPSPTSWL